MEFCSVTLVGKLFELWTVFTFFTNAAFGKLFLQEHESCRPYLPVVSFEKSVL